MKGITGSKRRIILFVIIILLTAVSCPICVYADAPDFTQAEMDYIRQSKPVRVCLHMDRTPFSQYDKETGKFRGICVEVLEEISKESGLKFEYVQQELGKTTPELFETGGFDIICGVERDNFDNNKDIIATHAFMESSIVPVALAGGEFTLGEKKVVAVPSSFQALLTKLEKAYPNLIIKKYKTNRLCLDEVMEERADAFIQNTHILGLLLQEPQYEGLDILPVEVMKEHTAMAMSAGENPLLMSIINKSIDNMDETIVTSALIEYTFGTQYEYTLMDFIYKFKVQIIIISALIACCFILLIRVGVVRRKNATLLQKKNESLMEAVEQANRANAAKSEFLARMSHEIRTPMNAIVGLTEIAKQHEKEPEKIDEYLKNIESSSKVLLSVINDVLDMSAIESNKLKIADTRFDMKQILTGLSTIYYSQCQIKGIDFQMSIDIDDEIYVGDSLRINQILMNLVSNAYKFTEPGGKISVIVTQTTHSDQNTYVRFVVSDTGCGMSEDMLSRLFKPFEPETAVSTRKYGGSGLGLSITKNLVDMMHGAIKASSKKGEGTTFTVDLPLTAVGTANGKGKDSLRDIRILTVDDDPAAREYTSIILNRIGVNFDMASSGQEAIDMINTANNKGLPYDVCLVDWKMPEMDGIEVTRRIRASEKKKTLVIIVSAYDLNEAKEQSETAGADYFVSKPLFQSTLFDILISLNRGVVPVIENAATNYDFSGKCVLLAEDNLLNAEIATELLSMANLRTVHVVNGLEAVKTFEASTPGTFNAILMDIQMPEMDGFEATKAIRCLERSDAKDIPIIAMTANAFAEDVTAALSAGTNGHIAKPIDIDRMYATLAEAIYKK